MPEPMQTPHGSGGGKGRGGGEKPDTLKSFSSAKILDVLCEGEIGGLVDGAESIYFNRTRLQNPDGTKNFEEGFGWEERKGTQEQTPIKLVGSTIESETNVGVEVHSGDPVVRTVVNPNLDAIKVRLHWDQIQEFKDKGGVEGSEVAFRISIQTQNGQFIERVADTVSGKSRSAYERQYYIEVNTEGPWNVRVERITPDSEDNQIQNEFSWLSYSEVIEEKLNYPNTAKVGLTFEAEQFSSIPERAYDIKGLLIRIPQNATVREDGSLAYNGIWDGTFKLAWCANPAWCLFDLLTNDRYGCDLPASSLDKAAFYQVGQYCDALVDDGTGGQEPRFTCNVYIQDRADAYNVINDFASVFRGQLYWGAGSVTVTQDAPATAVRMFNPATVKDGLFTYSGTAKRARHTVALVRWNDPNDFYKQGIEPIEDAAGIRLYGVNELAVTAFACTSRSQAHRVGKWLLYTEQFETDTVSFTTDAEGIPVRPGEVIQIGDPKRIGSRQFGRIATATPTQIQVDQVVTIQAGQTYSLGVMLPGGQLEEQLVTTPPGNVAVLTVGQPFTQLPQAESAWILNQSDQDPRLYRVLSATETTTKSNEYEITALSHQPQKYDLVESDLKFEPKAERRKPQGRVNPPRELTVQTPVVMQDDVRLVNLNADWQPPVHNGQPDAYIHGYIAEFRAGKSGSWGGTTSTRSQSCDWFNLPVADYYVRIRSVDVFGQQSGWVTVTTPTRPLDPPQILRYVPDDGVVGDTVVITGRNFTGASRVRFDLTTAAFVINSPTQIIAQVPAGATSGKIYIRTSGGEASL